MTPLLSHPCWVEIAQYLRVEIYARDGGHVHPRYRLEVKTPADSKVLHRLLALEVPCAVCSRSIHPVRQRAKAPPVRQRVPAAAHLYLAVTCPLNVSIGCARSRAAAAAYTAIAAALGAVRP